MSALPSPDPVTGYRIVPARALVSALPADLPAVLFLDRPPVGDTVRVYAVGDTGLSGQVARTAAEAGHDILLADVAPVLRAGELVFGNLEATLIERPTGATLFAAPPGAAAALRQAGFAILQLANNHVYDYGPEGLVSTLAAVRAANLTPLGAGADAAESRRLVRTDRRGVRVGWLGCGRTLTPQGTGPRFWEFDEQELLAAIREARPSVDVLIVSVHIGFMYLDYPHPDHKAMAERCARAGADVVLMHHPHVLQGVDITPDGKVLCYSLGNFLFDQKEGLLAKKAIVREQNEGAVFLFELDRSGVSRAAAVPTSIDDRCCVRWACGPQADAIVDRLVEISRDLRGDYAQAFWRQRSERDTGHVLRMFAYYLRHRRWRDLRRMAGKVRREHLVMLVRWILGRVRAPFRRRVYAPTP
jgi:poly-gamma-glutamate synthesis protein (capsule biosynthesis protein)